MACRTIYLTSGIGKKINTRNSLLLGLQDAIKKIVSIMVQVSNMLARLADEAFGMWFANCSCNY